MFYILTSRHVTHKQTTNTNANTHPCPVCRRTSTHTWKKNGAVRGQLTWTRQTPQNGLPPSATADPHSGSPSDTPPDVSGGTPPDPSGGSPPPPKDTCEAEEVEDIDSEKRVPVIKPAIAHVYKGRVADAPEETIEVVDSVVPSGHRREGGRERSFIVLARNLRRSARQEQRATQGLLLSLQNPPQKQDGRFAERRRPQQFHTRTLNFSTLCTTFCELCTPT